MTTRRKFIQSIGVAAATPAFLGGVGGSETLTPLASEWGALFKLPWQTTVTANDIPTYSDGQLAWAVTYSDDGGLDALQSRIDARDGLEELSHIEDSKTVFAKAPDDEVGTRLRDRLFGSGLQAMTGIERIDLVVTVSRPEPVTSLIDEDEFETPSFLDAGRSATSETTGIAFEAEETTTLGDVRETLGVDDADIPPLADLETVKVGVVDTGINVDNGQVWGRGDRFSPIRIPAAKDFTDAEEGEADVVWGRVTLENITDSDFNDGTWDRFVFGSTGDDAYLETDLDTEAGEETAEYVGAVHSLEDVDTAFVELELDLADATVTLEAREGSDEEWTEMLSETVTESDTHEFDVTDGDEYAEWRWTILIDAGEDAGDETGEIHSEGLESPEQILNDDSDWSPVQDGDGHGSWCAAAIAADPHDNDYRGVAADAPIDLFVARALDENGNGSTKSIAEAIDWMREEGVDVINLSLGSQFYNEVIDDAIERFLEDGGSAVVAAAGNDRQLSRWLNSPADSEHTISVAATTNEPPEDAQVGYFSNVGPSDGATNLSGGATSGVGMDVGAPGIDITARFPSPTGILRDRTLTGTSMAAPCGVTGSIALLLAVEPSLKGNSEEIRERLKETAEPIKNAGETEVGAGMPQIDRLLEDDRDGPDQSEVVELPAASRDTANRAMTGGWLFGGD